MTRFGKRLIQAAKEAVEIAQGKRPARVWVQCACGVRFLIPWVPGPNEKFFCADCGPPTQQDVADEVMKRRHGALRDLAKR